MSKKKDWISPSIHPNNGAVAHGWLKNIATGANLYREVLWNRTHWMVWNSATKDYMSIPGELELIGWSL